MPPDQLFVCILTLVVIALFIWDRLPMEIVSLGALLLLMVVPFNGHPILLPPDKSSQSQIMGDIFGNNAILVVSFMFIVGAAVERTGLVEDLGHWFERIAGTSYLRILLSLGVLSIIASAFLNNTTVVVVFIPMLIGLCKRNNLAPSRYLIPLSYFAICGGMITIIGTSTNLIVNGVIRQKGLEPFAIFDIAPLGIIFSVATILYLLIFGRKLLPDRPSLAALINVDDSREFLTAAIVGTDSPLVGKTITETPLARMRNSQVIELRRSGNRVRRPLQAALQAGDRLIFKSQLSGVMDINALKGLEIASKSEMGLSYVQTEQAVLMEGMIGRQSRLIGHSLQEQDLRQKYGVIILAVHRQGMNLRENFETEKLEIGDTLLLEGSSERMRQLFEERDLINLSEPKTNTYRRNKAWIALIALALVVVCGAINNLIPFEWVAMAAALLVTVSGCLKTEEAYRAIDWSVITMILGTLGLGLAMDLTGAASTIVHSMMAVIGNWDKRLIISAVLLLSIFLTEVLSNNAVAALVTPLAINLAKDLDCNWQPFVVAVMVGASIGFAIPAGYQTHMLVFGPGGYRFSDFIRAGIPLDLFMWILGSICIPIIWSL